MKRDVLSFVGLIVCIAVCAPYWVWGALPLVSSLLGRMELYVPLEAYRLGITMPVNEPLCAVADNSHSLNTFFRELDGLKKGEDRVVNIVHLGDSHIQAGYYSGQVMRLLQQEFGNAGRGWIAPFRLSRVNEPSDYFISSSVKTWEAGRAIQSDRKVPVGVGGIGIRTAASSVDMDIIIAPNNGAGYSFNRAVFYRDEKATPLLPNAKMTDRVSAQLGKTACVPGVVADTFVFSCLTDTLLLQSKRGAGASSSSVYYGLNLTNGHAGVLYHSIGVNGSMFVNYTDPDYVCQLALLQPSLLIVSLGTNETFGKRFTGAQFSEQIKAFLSLVKTYLPETAILLTTPAECCKTTRVNRKTTYVRNANTELAAEAIVDVAREEGIACWDLFAATGGKNSYKSWYERKLFGRDRVHFTKEGYQEQGTLLFYGLMQLYNTQH